MQEFPFQTMITCAFVVMCAFGAIGVVVAVHWLVGLARRLAQKPPFHAPAGDPQAQAILLALREQIAIMRDPGQSDPTLQSILEAVEASNRDASKRHERQTVALDSMSQSLSEFSTTQRAFLRAMLGDSVLPREEQPQEDREVEEAARALMKKFSCTREEALQRAREIFVYRDGQGMGGRA